MHDSINQWIEQVPPEINPGDGNKAENRKPRDKGYGRTQKLPVDEKVETQPSCLGSLATSILASALATCKLKKQNIIAVVTSNINRSLGKFANNYNLEKEAA